jgi:toxin ParE1/3/4
MKRYILSREAGLDLAAIEDYTARTWNDAQAERYIHALFAAFAKLAKNPKLGHKRQDVPAPYLCYASGKHLIIYRARAQVEILTILHPAMDIEKRLQAALLRLAQRQ